MAKSRKKAKPDVDPAVALKVTCGLCGRELANKMQMRCYPNEGCSIKLAADAAAYVEQRARQDAVAAEEAAVRRLEFETNRQRLVAEATAAAEADATIARCRECSAAIGQPCTKSGVQWNKFHAKRKLDATTMNEELAANPRIYAVTCPTCKALVNVGCTQNGEMATKVVKSHADRIRASEGRLAA